MMKGICWHWNSAPRGHGLSVVYLSTFSNIFFSEGLIEAKLHMELPWIGWMKVWLQGLGYMTKMATRSIYGKNPFNFFLLGNQWSRGHGMQHLGVGSIIFCSHDDPGLTLTYFYGKVRFGLLGKRMYKIRARDRGSIQVKYPYVLSKYSVILKNLGIDTQLIWQYPVISNFKGEN